jgi:hypothetical protein
MWPSLPAGAGELGGILRRAAHMLRPQLARPFHVQDPALDDSGERRQRKARMCVQLDLAAAVLAQLLRVVGDADPPCMRKDGGRAISDLIVELAPDGDDEVRVLHRSRAHRADVRGVRAGTRPRLSCVSR